MDRRNLLLGMTAAASIGALGFTWRRSRTVRPVATLLAAEAVTDGAGVHLRRAIGGRALRNLDPFLLLDEFKSTDPNDYLAGFPRHPHRGFETVTIMLDGAMQHRDSVGKEGRLGPGSVQWMTAGRGIVHEEMPKQEAGRMWGFQLWVNLPARLKFTPPRYQNLDPVAVPEVQVADARVRVLAGVSGGAKGPVDGVIVAPTVLDVTLPEGGELSQAVPGGHTAFAYVTDGTARFGDTDVPAGSFAVLGRGDQIEVKGGSRFLLVAGAPIGEPIARRGPFVMNTEAELDEAYADYRAGRLGGG